MILVNKTKVQLKKKYHKILYLYPAIDETFVFLGMRGLRQDCVTHMDKNGTILFEHIFQKPMDSFGMLNQSQAIMNETRGNCITILNLKTHQFKRTSHHFFNEQSDQANIITFSETKFLCIEQFGRYNDNRYKLSYYNYPLEEQSKPFNVYQAKNNEWTYEYLVKKANQHSMIAWFKPRQDKEWDFRTYDVRDNPQGKFIIHKFPQQIGIPYNMSKVEVAINTLWETTKDIFMLVCISNKKQEQINQDLGVIQNIYICDTKKGDIREAKFSFGQYHPYLIDTLNIGRWSMFRTFFFKNGETLESPVFYIKNQSQDIIFEEKWKCSYLHKYQFPGYAQDTMIENLYENSDCDWFQCIVKKPAEMKQIILQFLHKCNQNFDDDLLQDVIEILDYEESQ